MADEIYQLPLSCGQTSCGESLTPPAAVDIHVDRMPGILVSNQLNWDRLRHVSSIITVQASNPPAVPRSRQLSKRNGVHGT